MKTTFKRMLVAAGVSMLANWMGNLLHARDANPPTSGAVSGVIVDASSGQPLRYATVTVKSKVDGIAPQSGATDEKGAFAFEDLPFGDYQLEYGVVGAQTPKTVPFTLPPAQGTTNLGRLILEVGNTVQLEKFEVSARQEAFYNSIDRKVYNVGRDIQSATGSASDLLKNVPSVQVDLEGNVSLRGDENVLILINGKSSAKMGRNRAAALEQMSADGIDKIEVITNPSAKYKPDGTAGIINITLKKSTEAGYSGSVRAAVGNSERYNANLTLNFNPGKYQIYGSVGLRQDDRPRFVDDERSHFDATTGTTIATSQRSVEETRPLSRLADAGVDYQLSEQTRIGGQMSYNYRDFVRRSSVTNRSRNTTSGTVTSDYDRMRVGPEFEEDLEFTATFDHAFPQPDHELSIEVAHEETTEEEDNHFTNVYRVPVRSPQLETTLLKTDETETEVTADYTLPLGDRAKIEAGYSGEAETVDMDFRGSAFDAAANAWVADATRTNRFIYDAKIHAAYGTYAHKISRFGVLGGLRFEQTNVDTDQVTAGLRAENSYGRFYPSLHVSYDLTDTQQLQANYSHRVNRPDGDDLNPFPEYQDPFNLRVGNPLLVPEDIHSFETGWQYRKDDTTYLATVYYRAMNNSVTDVTRYIDATTLLTTKENLGTSRSGGLELGATTRVQDRLSLDFSANVYRNEIDAQNLGFSSRRATIAWDAKVNASWDFSKSTLVQLNTNYTAKRLTPQGYRHPTYVANLGLRHNFKDGRTAAILSVSDIFNSLRERTEIDTPLLRQETIRRRSSRIVYIGLIYNFGKAAKKQNEDMQFDTAL